MAVQSYHSHNDHNESSALTEFTPQKVELLKNTICKGATDDELELFVMACKRMGLDPFMKQIYAVKRKTWEDGQSKEVMTIQTGIDGYRLIAERSGKYMPGKEPSFTYTKDGRLHSATAYVKKMGPDNQWHEISGTAFFSEYASVKKDGTPTNMWATKPHIMLAKCAESLTLRKAFPAELSGVYTSDEMDSVSKPNEPIAINSNVNRSTGEVINHPVFISQWQIEQIESLIAADDQEYKDRLLDYYKIGSFSELQVERFAKLIEAIKKHNQERLATVPNKQDEIDF